MHIVGPFLGLVKPLASTPPMAQGLSYKDRANMTKQGRV